MFRIASKLTSIAVMFAAWFDLPDLDAVRAMTVTVHFWQVIAFVVAVPAGLEVVYLAFLWHLSREGRR